MSRKRIVNSIAQELIEKARESALSSVQIFNNPLIKFKSEIFIVLIVIAWTYLLHAYYRKNKINYKYIKTKTAKRTTYEKTPGGAYKYWDLSKCLRSERCPLDDATKKNLDFLIEFRHEIEHRMTTKIDNKVSSKFQACCLNFNKYIQDFFGKNFSITKYLSFSLQFSSISVSQKEELLADTALPKHIASFINNFETNTDVSLKNQASYDYKVFLTRMTVNNPRKANHIVSIIPIDSELENDINVCFKERDKTKYKPSDIVKMMNDEGFKEFGMYQHTQLWKRLNAKADNKYGGLLYEGREDWGWYVSWIEEVRKHCMETYSQSVN